MAAYENVKLYNNFFRLGLAVCDQGAKGNVENHWQMRNMIPTAHVTKYIQWHIMPSFLTDTVQLPVLVGVDNRRKDVSWANKVTLKYRDDIAPYLPTTESSENRS